MIQEHCKYRVVKKKDSKFFGRAFYCCNRPKGSKDDPEADWYAYVIVIIIVVDLK